MDYGKGTQVEDAIHDLVARDVPIGGTSAGLALMGEFSFSAANGTVDSSTALSNPYNRTVALGMEPDGNAVVFGSGAAYFLQTPGLPEVCQPKTDLAYQAIDVYRVSGAATFNLATWTGSGGTAYTLGVEAGAVTSTQSGGGIY